MNVNELIKTKESKLQKYFKEVEVLNRNRFKCRRNSGEWCMVVVTDNLFMSVDGKPVQYID